MFGVWVWGHNFKALNMGGRWFRKLMLEYEPDYYEDEGDSPLIDEALAEVRRGPVMPRLGSLDDEEDLHVV